jgi:competence ComEA-like helix-hairpin-helix protein
MTRRARPAPRSGMATSRSRTHLMLLLVLGLGLGSRFLPGGPGGGGNSGSGVAELDRQIARVDSARQRARSRVAGTGGASARARPSRAKPAPSTRKAQGDAGSRSEFAGGIRIEHTPLGALDPRTLRNVVRPESSLVDVNTASAAELERLPGIGPALARRVLDDRDQRGPFASAADFQRVRGVGPALARRLEGRVTFGGSGRPSNALSIVGDTARSSGRRRRVAGRPP